MCCVGDHCNIKADANHLYVIVSPENFTLLINGERYQFVPYKAKEIMINRKTKKIANPEAEFAFQKDGQVIYITMEQLMKLVDFLHFVEILQSRATDPILHASSLQYSLNFSLLLQFINRCVKTK